MKKILIVDDNKDNQYMLEVLLSSNGFTVITSSNGAEALEKAKGELPDIIVSDILMPVMDGYSLCKEWRSTEQLKDIPFIFYTATYTDPKDKEFALSLGADRFLIKPTETEELVKVINEVLKKNSTKKTAPHAGQTSDNSYYKQYNETLIRKLEQKMIQLEETNNSLREEILERKKAEESLKISLEEKMTLLRELYHRTGNNMQLISSLLSIKLGYVHSKELESFVEDMQNKIGAMALVHQKLYNAKNLTSISLSEYMRELCENQLINSAIVHNSVSFDYDIEEINVIIEVAVPFGLILNELISNSFRHAFSKNDTGLITISLHRGADNILEFAYSDNGTGLPDGFNLDSEAKMGFSLILLLIKEQLRGEINISNINGFHCLIRFDDSMITYKE